MIPDKKTLHELIGSSKRGPTGTLSDLLQKDAAFEHAHPRGPGGRWVRLLSAGDFDYKPWDRERSPSRFKAQPRPRTLHEAFEKEPERPVALAGEIEGRVKSLNLNDPYRLPEGSTVEKLSPRKWRVDGPTGITLHTSSQSAARKLEDEETTARSDRFANTIPGNPMGPVAGVDDPGDPISNQIGGVLHGGRTQFPNGTKAHRIIGPHSQDTFEITSPSGQREVVRASDKPAIVRVVQSFERQAGDGGGHHDPHPVVPRSKYKGGKGPLRTIPDKYNRTRVEMHRLSSQILGYADRSPRVALVRTTGGFGTPVYEIDDVANHHAQLRVEGTDLVHTVDGREVGREPIPNVDPDAAKSLADFYKFSSDMLHELQGEGDQHGSAASKYNAPIVWSEHFDIAIELGPQPGGTVIGASPGDSTHPEPYFYVGPWDPVKGPLWNAQTFNGAELPYSEVMASPDQRKTIMDFYRQRLTALGLINPDKVAKLKDMSEIAKRFNPKQPRNPHTGEWISIGITPNRKSYGSYKEAETALNSFEFKKQSAAMMADLADGPAHTVDSAPRIGLWEGEFEPSMRVHAEGNPDETHAHAEKVATGKFKQDAIISFEQGKGQDRSVTVDNIEDPDKFAKKLKQLGIPGATFTTGGKHKRAFIYLSAGQKQEFNKLTNHVQSARNPLVMSTKRGKIRF